MINIINHIFATYHTNAIIQVMYHIHTIACSMKGIAIFLFYNYFILNIKTRVIE